MHEREKLEYREKINQRLFKRLILYYNVDCGLPARPTKYSQKQTALHQIPDDSHRAVNQVTRARQTGRKSPSAAFPFNAAMAGTGSLTAFTDENRTSILQNLG